MLPRQAELEESVSKIELADNDHRLHLIESELALLQTTLLTLDTTAENIGDKITEASKHVTEIKATIEDLKDVRAIVVSHLLIAPEPG